jgi:hypothetical protein
MICIIKSWEKSKFHSQCDSKSSFESLCGAFRFAGEGLYQIESLKKSAINHAPRSRKLLEFQKRE